MSRDSIQTFYEPKAGGIGEGQLGGENRAEYMRPSLAFCRFACTKEAIGWWPGLFPLVFVGRARAEQAVRVLVEKYVWSGLQESQMEAKAHDRCFLRVVILA